MLKWIGGIAHDGLVAIGIADAPGRTPEYAFLASLDAAAQAEIRAGQLNMIDLQGVLDPLGQGRYVDSDHYSPAAHREIAEAIFAHTKSLNR